MTAVGNAFYCSVQSILCFNLLSKIIKIKIYRVIIMIVVLYGWETWSLTLKGDGEVGLGCLRIGC